MWNPARILLLLAVVLCHGCSSAPSMRIVTWNIHHGAGLDGRVDLERIADELRQLAPDVVLLQEVDVGCARSGRVDTPRVLAERLGMESAFDENIPFQGGSYGNAILSRWPIETQQNLHYRMLREGEQRGLLRVRLAAPGGPVAVGVTHIDHRPDDGERLANAEQILHLVAAAGFVAVGGDFNDLPGSRVHQRLCGPLRDAWLEADGAGDGASYPAESPRKRIDWLLLAPGPWRTAAAHVASTTASDHCPVVFELVRDGRNEER